QGEGVAGFVLPGLEVHGLAGADTEEDAENFAVVDLAGEGWVKAGAATLDEGKVESGGEGDGLEVVGDAGCVVAAEKAASGVGVGPWDGGVPADVQAGDGLKERCAGVDVGVGDAAVAGPEAGVDGELHDVGEAEP